MSQTIPQEILDSLTRVDMPKGINNREINEIVEIEGLNIPVYRSQALVIGSGAAGLRAATELKRQGVATTIASTGLFSGTSACSGSDKQTLHTAGTNKNGDNFKKLSQDIGSGGAMDKDTAYVESVGSIKAFAGLQYMGLPLPQDRYGAVLRYQTDHDEVGRATSCGPRTSRLMVKVLCEEAMRVGVDFLKDVTAIKILKEKNDNGEDVCKGILAVERNTEHNQYGLMLLLSERVVLATGGPGELYRDSVYPKFCFGSLGMAIESGLKVVNLTESQFGIGTRRTEFPWNLSGTYVQVMPYIYSTDAEGNEYNFLADYYRTTQELVSNVFRKGYQWPFHATRMENFGSSLVDLAIFEESQKGRTILMDFNRNPEMVPGDKAFSLDELDEDVGNYLSNNQARQDLPIDRLRQMNPLAIELYKMHGHDISTDPLPFNVSNQHMNGGIDVDIYSQSSLKGCYAIGEVAGTHGVTRPGGAALNAGQVFGMRCAEHISYSEAPLPTSDSYKTVSDSIADTISYIRESEKLESSFKMSEIRDEVQARMSDKAGFICNADDVNDALNQAHDLNSRISEKGIEVKNSFLAHHFQWRQTALSSEAVLTALDHYIKNGGGSRGARALCSTKGEVVPESRIGLLEKYRFIQEKEEHKDLKITIQYVDGAFKINEEKIRELDNLDEIFFEKNWGQSLTGAIYQ